MQMNLNIDDDILAAAQAMAKQQDKSVDEIISDLIRRSIDLTRPRETRNGVPLLPRKPGSTQTTMEMVNALRDDES